MWRGEPFLRNMHKQHLSAVRAQVQIGVGRLEMQISASRAEMQISAGHDEMQISAGHAELQIVDDSENDFEDEFEVLEGMHVGIPECEGLPGRLWNTKCVTLYNDEGLLVGEGTCHSMNSDLVLGATSPLGDTHVAVFVAKSH